MGILWFSFVAANIWHGKKYNYVKSIKKEKLVWKWLLSQKWGHRISAEAHIISWPNHIKGTRLVSFIYPVRCLSGEKAGRCSWFWHYQLWVNKVTFILRKNMPTNDEKSQLWKIFVNAKWSTLTPNLRMSRTWCCSLPQSTSRVLQRQDRIWTVLRPRSLPLRCYSDYIIK